MFAVGYFKTFFLDEWFGGGPGVLFPICIVVATFLEGNFDLNLQYILCLNLSQVRNDLNLVKHHRLADH